MRKILFILFASLAVFIAAIEISMYYVKEQMKHEAHQLNTQIVRNLKYELDQRLTWTDGGSVHDPNRLRNYLRRSLPYDGEMSAITLFDSCKNVLLSTNEHYEKYTSLKQIKSISFDDFKKIESNDSLVRQYLVHENGHLYFDYLISLSYVPWYIGVECDSEVVYQHAVQVRHLVWLICGIGLMLMLICGYFIIRQVKQNMRREAALEKELTLAAGVQMQMLRPTPAHFDSVTVNAILRPAREAGGDLYDFVEREGLLIFCIGDVSGKGMSAALFMTQICSLFRREARSSTSPQHIMSRINSIVSADNPTMTFCTLFIGCLNIKTGELEYCNAGHNRPVLISPNEAKLIDIIPNISTGLVEDYTFKSEIMTIQNGESLFLYTDGVTEAMNLQHQQFSETRMLQTLRNVSTHTSTKHISHLFDDIKTFTGEAEQNDDITMLEIIVK